MAKWFYYKESGEKVEVTDGQLKGLAKAGMITPNTVVEIEEGKSAPARKVKGLTFGDTRQSESTAENSFTDEHMAIDESCTAHGTNVSKVHEKNEFSLLCKAAIEKTLTIVKYLISQGAEVNSKINKCLSGIPVATPIVAMQLTENSFELHETMKKNAILNANVPSINKTALLSYKCKHCGYEWIYLLGSTLNVQKNNNQFR